MIDLCEFILKNFRENVPWKVYQAGKVLAKGTGTIENVFEEIKNTEIHIPSDEEIAKEVELKEQAYKARMEKLKKAQKERADKENKVLNILKPKEKESKKRVKCKHKYCSRSVITGQDECYVCYATRGDRKNIIDLSDTDIKVIDKILDKYTKK